MIDGRRLAHVYNSPVDVSLAFDDFVADNSAAIASLNPRQRIIEMRNGDKVYFFVIRNTRDILSVSGYHFNSVSVYKGMDEEVRQYLRARMRDARGGQLVDNDLIEREDV